MRSPSTSELKWYRKTAGLLGILGLIILCGSCLSCSRVKQSTAESWLNPPPELFVNSKDIKIVPASDFYEVSASKVEAATFWLKKQDALALSVTDAQFLTGMHYPATIPSGQKPYLVRAVFNAGGNGKYSVKREGNVLWIEFDGLAHSVLPEESAVIVNLSSKPTMLYISMHVIE